MKNLFLLILIFPLTSCGKNELNWLILSPNNIEGLTNLKFLLSGITTTIYISIVSIIISIILGLLVAIPSLAKSKFLTYLNIGCLLYTSPSPRDATLSRMPSSA